MEDVQSLSRNAIAEMEKLLSSKRVMGDPVTVEGNTIIPLLSIGFGFGSGFGLGTGGGPGRGKNGPGGEGSGGGTGGGGGVKPVAVIIINQSGVKVEPISGAGGAMEKLGMGIAAAFQRRTENSQKE